MELEELIKYLVFSNYLKYKNNFKVNSIIGKLILINPAWKNNIKEIIKIAELHYLEVNKLSKEEILDFLKSKESIFNKLLENKEKNRTKERDLPPLDLSNIEQFGAFRVRFEPSPSGPLHIGHAIGVIINYLYYKKYKEEGLKSEFQLRLADTNPKNIMTEAYDYIVDDVEYLTGERFDPVIQSKRINIYYDKVKVLLEKGLAYVATYEKGSEKEYVKVANTKLDKVIVKQRDKTIEENLDLWEKMLNNEFEEGEAIVRIKTTINKDPNEKLEDVVTYYKNSSLIDFPLFRIVEEEHPLINNIIVWPLMNFSVPIDDMLFKLSHIIRGKDHEMNGEKQKIVYKYFDAPLPNFIYFGRVNFYDLKVSTSLTKNLILEGKYESWEDLRLPFLKALKRRGIQRYALQKYAKEFGTSKSDKKTSMEEFFKTLYKFNREYLDPLVNRYFLIRNPIKLNLGIDEEIKLKKKPNSDEFRTIRVKKCVFVNKDTLEKLYNKGINKVRLMHLKTIEFDKVGEDIVIKKTSDEIVKNKIEWVSCQNYEEISLVSVVNNQILKEKVLVDKEALLEEIFQAERIGFIKNEKEKEQLIFMHK